MAELLILQDDPQAYPRLLHALEPRFQCQRIPSLSDVPTHLPSSGPRGCILDFFDPAIPIPLSALRHLRRRHPDLTLVVVGDFSGREMDLYYLGRVSVDGVIRLEKNPSPREILAVVEKAFTTRLAEVVVATVGQDLPPLAMEALRWAIERAETRPRVEDLASGLGLPSRTLLRQLRADRVSPPRTFLLWGRLIRACYLLERPRETVEAVAYRLGYATAGTLRKALKQHVGCTPSSLHHRGGMGWVLGVLGREGLRRDRQPNERWTHTRNRPWPMTKRPPSLT